MARIGIAIKEAITMRSAAIILTLGVLFLLTGCGGNMNQNIPPQYPSPVTMPSGLVYQDFKYGNGTIPNRGEVISIRYSTHLQNGQLVESSEYYSFPAGIGKVIAGWEQGIANMTIGAQRKLTIPPELAYGETGRPPSIPPNATLTSYIELLGVEPPQMLNEGLRYYDIIEGYGQTPIQDDSLQVNYTGWLQMDGAQFDSSLNEGREPFLFNLGAGQVIKGWDQGLANMRVGGKRILIVPPNLGYGDQGSGSIPGGATLVFEVDLLAINPEPQ